ncbi:MAG: hypothetical protein ABJB98_09530 [Actinomycetota bacterium]
MSSVVHERSVRLGGHTVSFREADPEDGPVVVLSHGLASDGGTWEPALVPLAEQRALRLTPENVVNLERAGRALTARHAARFADVLADFVLTAAPAV